MIAVEEIKEEEKTLALSSALAELVVDSKDVKNFQIRKGFEKKDKQDVTEAVLIFEQIQIEEKTSLDQKKRNNF